jgi:hypothetical protein
MYLRQLLRMHDDFATWRNEYRDAASTHLDDWLGSRYADRVDTLDGALHLVEQLQAAVYGFPRLK